MVKTLQQEIVETFEGYEELCTNLLGGAGNIHFKYWQEKLHKIADLKSKVESARCGECSIKDKLLKEMAEALEEIVRCLSHGLQDSRASMTAKAMMQKYHEQIGELK